MTTESSGVAAGEAVAAPPPSPPPSPTLVSASSASIAPSAAEEFASFYAAEHLRVCATLTLAVGDRGLAEEATAEAFARALSRWAQLRAKGTPTGWVYTVALNEVRSRMRRARLERRYLARQRLGAVPPAGEPDPALWAAVAQLGPRARQAIALRYIADLTEAEVAEAMGISRGTVASTLSKARARLQEQLGERSER